MIGRLKIVSGLSTSCKFTGEVVQSSSPIFLLTEEHIIYIINIMNVEINIEK